MTERPPLRARRALLLKKLVDAAEEIKRIDDRLDSLLAGKGRGGATA